MFPGTGEKMSNMFSSRNIGIAALLIGAGFVGYKSTYIASPQETAVITRFGKEIRQKRGGGLDFVLPVFDRVYKVNTEQVNSLEIGFKSIPGSKQFLEAESNPEIEYDAKMLTGDLSIIYGSMVVQYRIKNPSAFLWEVQEPEKLLEQSAISALRKNVGDVSALYTLTIGRSEIERKTREDLQANLDQHGGIYHVSVQFQNPRVPRQVQPAYADVINAKEEGLKMAHQAEGLANELLPQARAEALNLLNSARAYSTEKISTAMGEVLSFDFALAQYEMNPEIFRAKIQYQTAGTFFANAERIFGEPERIIFGPSNISKTNIVPTIEKAVGGSK